LFFFSGNEIFGLAQRGDPAPSGGVFSLFFATSLNNLGQIAFSAGLTTGDTGIYLFNGDTIEAIARSGDYIGGCGTLRDFFQPVLNDHGQVAFIGRVATRDGIFLHDGGEVRSVACPGDSAPGGGTFVRTRTPSLNNSGSIVFEGGVTSPGHLGIFLYEKEQLRQIARRGDAAPDGGTFLDLYLPVINNAGQVTFGSSLLPTPETEAAFIINGEKMRRILPYQDPGTGDTISIRYPRGNSGHPLSFDDLGQLAFEGEQSSSEGNHRGLFFFDGENFSTIAFADDLVPDPRGYVYGDFFRMKLNNFGAIAFEAGWYLRGDRGLFLAIPDSP
jgi:hypothetical protein